jgi:hypothetical protein
VKKKSISEVKILERRLDLMANGLLPSGGKISFQDQPTALYKKKHGGVLQTRGRYGIGSAYQKAVHGHGWTIRDDRPKVRQEFVWMLYYVFLCRPHNIKHNNN